MTSMKLYGPYSEDSYHSQATTPNRVSLKDVESLIERYNDKYGTECHPINNSWGRWALFDGATGFCLTEYMTTRELYIFLLGTLTEGPYYHYIESKEAK